MTHLRRWGLLWGALVISLLLVGNAVWMRDGVRRHYREMAFVHGLYIDSRSPSDMSDLQAVLDRMMRAGVRSLSRFEGSDAQAVQVVGRTRHPNLRPAQGALAVRRDLFRVELPRHPGIVAEYHPLLAEDLLGRANRGLWLAIVASALLLMFVFGWTRYRIRLEQAARDAERNRHLAHLGTLSATVAHELRNPLAVLLGHVQLLREELPDSRSLQHIESGAQRLNHKLDALLQFARTGEVALEPVEPLALLRQVVADGAWSKVQVSGQAPVWSLDPVRMRQVLANIIANAVAACPDGPVSATVGVEQGALVFTVEDQGDGIPDGMHEAIFEPFVTQRTQGTGLGLAIAREIVHKHGGTLTAHDAPSGGARFVARIVS